MGDISGIITMLIILPMLPQLLQGLGGGMGQGYQPVGQSYLPPVVLDQPRSPWAPGGPGAYQWGYRPQTVGQLFRPPY